MNESNKRERRYSEGPKSPDRRAFLRRTAGKVGRAGVVAGILGAYTILRAGAADPRGARGDLGILRPPGAPSEREFMAACIRCTRCADACEVESIRLFGPEAGALQGTPYLVPRDSACTMCLACGEACPTEALRPLEQKEDIRMGVATIDDRLCVSINGTGICGACFTVCPLRGRAITQGIRNAPEVHAQYCTGCGLCEEFCIVDDRENLRAIEIRSDRRSPQSRKAGVS